MVLDVQVQIKNLTCQVLTDELLTVYCLNEHASCKHADITIQIFESVGICHQVPESLMDAFTGLSGSGPAYVSAADKKPAHKQAIKSVIRD